MNSSSFLFGTPWPWWTIIVTGAGACYLTWRGYLRRSGEVKAPRLKLLNAMRFAAWGLLVFCLLQPMRRENLREEKPSRLTVLADTSESMSFSDKRKAPARIERVKAALLGENSAAEGEKIPDDAGLLAKLSRSFAVQVETFGASSRVVAQAGMLDPKALATELNADGEATDVAKALSESFTRLRGPDASGLVLVSDGADTARGDIDRVAAQYKRSGIPIYTLGVGEADLQDLSIAQIRAKRTVSKDTLARVEVDVRSIGLSAGKQTVYISKKGKKVGSPVVVESKTEMTTAVFEFLPDEQGFLEYEATVEPFPGEMVVSNNTMAFGLVAYSRKLKVLYMEGSMFVHKTYDSKSSGMYYSHPMQSWWEHEFLERALTEDLDVEVDVLAKEIFSTPLGATRLSIKTVKEGYPKTKKELYEYDAIISSDIPYSHFTEDQIQWTVDFVGKHGGGFCMIGGYDSFGEGKYSKTIVDRMLPVEMNANDDHAEDPRYPVKWQLTDEAWSHEIMQLEKDPEKNRQAWAKLPEFHGFSKTTHKKGAATALAVVEDEEHYGTAYGPAILVAVQPYGNGRSMAFTSDSTGSWGTEWEDTWGPPDETGLMERNKYFKTFWKNTIRWLAHYRMQAPNQLVRIESDRLVYSRGETPELRVKVMNQDYELTHDAKVTIAVTGPDGKTQQLSVFPMYEEPGIFERKLEMPAVGRYEIEATAILGKEELGKDKTILQVRPASAEMRQLSQNTKLLKQLAEQSGGKYLPLERASELPAYLREATHVIEKHRDNDLWDRAWIFALMIGLFCGEWFLRKRSGLP